MEIKHGYKQTEIGVIPESWKTKKLEDLGQWKGGMTPSMGNPVYWKNGTVPWISSGDVKTTVLNNTAFEVSDCAIRNRATTLVPPETIIIVTRSGILRKFLPVAITGKTMAINQDIKALIPQNDIHSRFIFHLLTGNGSRILAQCLKSGTTVESIEFKWLKAFNIPLPPPFEQCAIAEVLSDVDGLLEGLERLIAKKRDLKQAAMQQLLTAQTRLPGFSGKWETKTFSEICDLKIGRTPSRLNPT
jgi:type I restriction enzyme S subunit